MPNKQTNDSESHRETDNRRTNETATSSRRMLLTSVVNPDWLGLSPLSYVVKWVPRKLDLTKPRCASHFTS